MPQQVAAGHLVPFEALQASAGSGKTFTLVVRYLALLFLDESPEEILALTFTNKAANEMQSRIVTTLAQLPNSSELAVIAGLCDMGPEAILARRCRVLERVLRAETRVMTIDSFFAKVLRKFAMHAGIMPTFTAYAAQHERRVRTHFLKLCETTGQERILVELALLGDKRLSDLFSMLNDLYARSPEIAAMRFTPDDPQPHALRAMDAYADLRAITDPLPFSERARSALAVDDFDGLLAASWVGRESLNYWVFKKAFVSAMDDCLGRIQGAIRDFAAAREQRFFAHLFTLLELFKTAKLSVAKGQNELGFDDVTMLVYDLLRGGVVPNDYLYFRLNSRISHLLLDEFQDTSVVQFEILRPLVEEMRAGSGVREHHSFFLVGDVKQSIYRFRGGSKSLFDAVIDDFDLQTGALLTNYRSSRNVVAFVNAVFRDPIPGYRDQQVREGAAPGFVEVSESESPLEEVARIVKRALAAGVNAPEIAVLTSTNGDGDAVQEHLRAEGIEVTTETTLKLIHQPRIAALIEWFKFCYFGEPLYARNFFALAELPPDALPRVNLMRARLVNAAIAMIRRYHLYDGDVNLIRFLEILIPYDEVERFLFEYERIDAPAAASARHGVRVLTVHKSKGLEFPYVIVMDRLSRGRSDSAPIIFDYDGTALQHLYLRQQKRDEIDPEYAGAVEREKQLRHDDALNALYVALTRARDNLYIIQKPKSSKFEMLSLEVAAWGEETFDTSRTKAPESVRPIAYEPVSLGRQEEILATTADEETEDPYAMTLGLAVHYTLEMMRRFDDASLSSALPATRNRYGGILGQSGLTDIRERIEKLIAFAPFIALCKGGEMAREQPISYRGELRYIDLLIRQPDRYIVIDYKSGQERDTLYRRQVGFYVKALKAITGMRVEGYLCYLLQEKVTMFRV